MKGDIVLDTLIVIVLISAVMLILSALSGLIEVLCDRLNTLKDKCAEGMNRLLKNRGR